MNISYNWLKEYVNFDLTPDETAAALTSIGLETGGVEEVQTIKIIIFPTTSPYGYSSFRKEEKLCRKLIYNSKNYKVTTKKATARLLLSVSQTDSPTAAQNRVPAAEGQNQHYRDSSSTPA